MKTGILLLGLLLLTGVQAGELYRSIDKDGKVHYGDRPLMDTEDVQELKLGQDPIPDDSLSYDAQRAKQNFPVTLYTASNGGQVNVQAREFLNKRGIPFTNKVLQTQEDVETFSKASGGNEVPALSVGRTWLKGFQAEQWNKELDFAGYPKTAPYRPRPDAPSAQPVP